MSNTRPAAHDPFKLCLVTDAALCLHHDLLRIVQLSVQAGVTCVQLREKDLSTRDFIERARAVKALLDGFEARVPLIINDRVDVALAIGADGIHVGQSDMPVQMVRQLMPKNTIVGVSITCVEDMQQTIDQHLHVDYLGVGPIFPTSTKADAAQALGLDGLQTIRAITVLPLMAIGGIQVANTAQVMQAGADGIAVVSAICAARDPEQVVHGFLSQISKAPYKGLVST